MNNTIFEIKERIWRKWMDFKNGIRYIDKDFPKMICVEISTICNRKCSYCVNSTAPSEKNTMSEQMFRQALFRLKEIGFDGKVVYSHFSEATIDKRLSKCIATTREVLPKANPVVYTNGDFLNDQFINDLISAGVSYISITRHPPFSQDWDNRIQYFRKKFSSHIQYRGEIKDKPWLFNFGGSVKNSLKARKWKTCDSIKWNMVIYYNGDIPLCTCAPYRVPIMGNIEKNSLLEIWRSPQYTILRNQAKSGYPTYPLCIKCYDRVT